MSLNAEAQLASAVMMVRPARFESNPNTLESNKFQGRTEATPEMQQAAALQEFDGIADELERHGIDVIRIDDTEDPHTPDAIFPNNWVSFHADGTVVLYPMLASNRRTERRRDIIDDLSATYGYQVSRIIDLSGHEEDNQFLEGTGSLVLDRAHRIAYACLSPRTHLDPLGDFAQQLDYAVVAFDAVDRDGAAIYHTNVMMNIGAKLAVICDVAITREDQRSAVLQQLEQTGHEVVSISMAQMEAFAGNMLELRARNGEPILAMSEQAYQSLTTAQLATIGRHAKIISAPIGAIEASAGGSVRCMLAEIHLPRIS
jgi:hypothetical protein